MGAYVQTKVGIGTGFALKKTGTHPHSNSTEAILG